MLVFEVALGPLENALDSLGDVKCRPGAEAGPQCGELGIGLGAQPVPDWSMLSSGSSASCSTYSVRGAAPPTGCFATVR